MGFQRCKSETETVLAAVSRLCRATTSGGGPLSLCVCVQLCTMLCVLCRNTRVGWGGRVQGFYNSEIFEDSKQPLEEVDCEGA